MFGLVMKKNPTKKLLNIGIESLPNKLTYASGTSLDLSGLTVLAYFITGIEYINDYTTNPANGTVLSTSNDQVTVSYTCNGITKTKVFDITVL